MSAQAPQPLPSTLTQSRARHRRWPWLLLIVGLGMGAWLYWHHGAADTTAAPGATAGAYGKHGGHGGGLPTPVRTVAATVGDVHETLDALGTVTPYYSVTVHTRVDGQLLKEHFQEGQLVHAGQLLAELDERPYQVQLTQAEGQLARDQALLKNAQLDLQRYQTLQAQDAIPRQQVDTQTALVAQDQGAVKIDQGAIDSAKLNLAYTRVTAPISGTAGLRQVDPGNIVHASDSNGLVIINQVQPISLLFTIPQDALPHVQQLLHDGKQLEVDAYDRALQHRLSSGVLLTTDNQIDPSTGTLKLKAVFPNHDLALFPQQFVNARLFLEIHHGAILVPTTAILTGNQGSFVYVANADKTVSVRNISTGLSENGLTAITDGLKAGERVVVDGTDKLRDGAKIEQVGDTPAVGGHGSGKKSGHHGGAGKKNQDSAS